MESLSKDLHESARKELARSLRDLKKILEDWPEDDIETVIRQLESEDAQEAPSDLDVKRLIEYASMVDFRCGWVGHYGAEYFWWQPSR